MSCNLPIAVARKLIRRGFSIAVDLQAEQHKMLVKMKQVQQIEIQIDEKVKRLLKGEDYGNIIHYCKLKLIGLPQPDENQ